MQCDNRLRLPCDGQHHERPAILGAICILVIMAGFDVWDDARQGESIGMLIWDVVLVGAVTGLCNIPGHLRCCAIVPVV